MSRSTWPSLAFALAGAIGIRPTGLAAPPAEVAPSRRRQAPAGVTTTHRAAIAALRTRPIGAALGPRYVRNVAKRYRQGRATWADVCAAARRPIVEIGGVAYPVRSISYRDADGGEGWRP